MAIEGIYDVRRCQKNLPHAINHTHVNRDNIREILYNGRSCTETSTTEHQKGKEAKEKGYNKNKNNQNDFRH